eukprot:Rhum_TRINITY_DN18707_c0_g1::Rhum_TRINITY_DN18707_c0_g1_i1::g.168188::m.168188
MMLSARFGARSREAAAAVAGATPLVTPPSASASQRRSLIGASSFESTAKVHKGKGSTYFTQEPAEFPLGSQPQSFRGQGDLAVATEGRVLNLEPHEIRARAVEPKYPTVTPRTKFDLDPRFWFRDEREPVTQPAVPKQISDSALAEGDVRRVLEGALLVPETWEDLGLNEEFTEVAKTWLGDKPATIQKDIVPALLNIKDRDLVYSSVTGTGKTAAYLLGLLQLISQEETGVNVVLVPSKQLAFQIYSHCLKWTNKGSLLGRTDKDWLQLHLNDPNEDDDTRREDVWRLRNKWDGGPRLVIAQPGRWADYLLLHKLKLPIKRIVIDEAFTCFDPIDPITAPSRVRRERNLNPNPTDLVMSYYLSFPAFKTVMRAQVVMLTATFTELLQDHVVRYLKPEAWTHLTTRQLLPPSLTHTFHLCEPGQALPRFLTDARGDAGAKRSVVFVGNSEDIDQVYVDMLEAGLNVRLFDAENGALPPFQDYSWQFLLLREQTAYGLDLKEVGHVYVLNCPTSKESYCHMAGRAGRFGAAGKVVNYVEQQDVGQWHAHMHLLDVGFTDTITDTHGNSAAPVVAEAALALRQESQAKGLQRHEKHITKWVERKKKLLYTLAREKGVEWSLSPAALPDSSFLHLTHFQNQSAELPAATMTDDELKAFYRSQREKFLGDALSLCPNAALKMEVLAPTRELRLDWLERTSTARSMKWMRKPNARAMRRAKRALGGVMHSKKGVLVGFTHNRLMHRFKTTSLAPETPATHSVPPVSRPVRQAGVVEDKWARPEDLPAYPGADIHKDAGRYEWGVHEAREEEMRERLRRHDAGLPDASYAPEPEVVVERPHKGNPFADG